MSKPIWIGQAAAVAQVVTVTLTAYDATTTYKLTIGGVTVSTLGTGGTTTTTAAALAAAWTASTHPYLVAVTASANSNVVTLTAATPGVPFTVASAVSGGTGTIGAAATATANAGPNDWSTAANWSTGAVPVNGDDVVIRNTAVPILWGLAQSAVTPASLTIEQSDSAQIGLPYYAFTSAAGTVDISVQEYRATYLAIGAAVVRIGENYSSTSQQGASLIKIDLGTTNAVVSAFNSGTPADNLPPILLKMNNAAAKLNVYSPAAVGLCAELPADSGQVASVSVFGNTSGGGDALVYVGAGVAVDSHYQYAGAAVIANAPTTLLQIEASAKATLIGSGTIAAVQKRGDLIMTGSYAFTNIKG